MTDVFKVLQTVFQANPHSFFCHSHTGEPCILVDEDLIALSTVIILELTPTSEQ